MMDTLSLCARLTLVCGNKMYMMQRIGSKGVARMERLIFLTKDHDCKKLVSAPYQMEVKYCWQLACATNCKQKGAFLLSRDACHL